MKEQDDKKGTKQKKCHRPNTGRFIMISSGTSTTPAAVWN